MKVLLIYLLIINAAAVLIMLVDKRKAVHGSFRIPEKVLFAFALVGGSLGGLIGMYAFRHKTRKLAFTIGFPLILLLQLLAITYFYYL